MRRSSFRFAFLVAPLLALTACGDGWETYRTTQIAPYGNARTAGSTVVYVRAKMMPKKELKLEPAVLKAEEIFTKAQEKGVVPSPVAQPVSSDTQADPAQDPVPETSEEDVLEQEHSASELLDVEPTNQATQDSVASSEIEDEAVTSSIVKEAEVEEVVEVEETTEVTPEAADSAVDEDVKTGKTYYFSDEGDLSEIETEAGDEVMNDAAMEDYSLPAGATSLEQIYTDTF